MKKLLSLLLMTTAITLFMSCSDDNPSPEPTTPQFAEVKLNCGGEFSVTEQPWTRATGGKTFYAFRIDSMQINKYKEPWGEEVVDTTFISYAEGLFDNKQDFSVKLQLGRKYRIQTLIINEETDHLISKANTYSQPFTKYGSGAWVPCTNSFEYTSNSNMMLDNYIAEVQENKLITMPSLEKFYGVKDIDCSSYIPNKIDISMFRYSFAIEVNITPPAIGEIVFGFDESTTIKDYVVKSTDSKFTDSNIFIVPHLTYENKDKSQRLGISIKWNKPGYPDANGRSISIRRNHKYTINIDFTNKDSNAGIDISQEDVIYEDGGTTNITHYNE